MILGHTINMSSVLYSSIYSFHMPMFFVLSGLFANANRYCFKHYLFRKTKQLLIPYIVCFFVGLLVSLIIPGWHNFNVVELLFSFFRFSSLDTTLVNVAPIWFLLCLYIVSLLFFPLYHVLKKQNPIFNFLIITVLVLVSYVITDFIEYEGHFFLCLDIAPVALTFYSIGYIFRKYFLSIYSFGKNRIWIIIFCFFVVAILPCKVLGIVKMAYNYYGSDRLIFFICAICGTIMVLMLASYLSKSKLLNYIGRNSIFIFAFHCILTRCYPVVLSNLFNEEITRENMNPFFTIVGFLLISFIIIVLSMIYNIIKKQFVVY